MAIDLFDVESGRHGDPETISERIARLRRAHELALREARRIERQLNAALLEQAESHLPEPPQRGT